MKTLSLIIGLFLFQTSWGALSGLAEVKGTTTNYKIKNGDGFADFGLVVPAMTTEELINFDLGKIISPENDTIKVFTYTLAVPSNLSVPKQTESYFISVTVDKNEFRAYLPEGEIYNLYALHGQFPVSDVIKGIQNKKSIFELVNFFKFYGGGTKNVKASGSTNVAIPIDNITFDKTFSVKAPTYAEGKEVISLGLFKNAGEFYPTDLKRIPSGKTEKLTSYSASPQYVLSLLVNNQAPRAFAEIIEDDVLLNFLNYSPDRAENYLQLSYTLQKATATTSPQFLSHIAEPEFVKAQKKLKANPPKAISGTAPYATLIVLSEVETGTGSVPVDFKKTLWSRTVMSWETSFDIPAEAINMIKNKKYSWDVVYMASDDANSDNSINWENVTHASRNSVNF